MKTKIKSNELIKIIRNFINYDKTPTENLVHFGCDCGCGGDYYINYPEQWTEDHEIVYKYRAELREVLEKLGIEIDTPELMDSYNNNNEEDEF